MQQPSVFTIARKETAAFFASPVAFIFFAAFLLVTLFIFFWVETFFARNIADVRPLFEWMPILLIFLVAALTMRMWSEERRAGTLEFLLTHPVSPLRLVLGKFLACLFLVALALLLTLPLPITISLLGNLDWGPVFGAYLASLLLAAAYIAIGLTVSANTNNQIVSLIVTVLLTSFLYLLGSDSLTGLLGNKAAEFFKLLGSGSRFESITRGVLDLRDLYYYLSIVGIFISLNVLSLEIVRWAHDNSHTEHRKWQVLTALLVANFLVGNIWLSQISKARIDLTEGDIYSISNATRNYLKQLQEPLLIRGYFSAKTHPLLSPLVPQLRDLLSEYQIAGNGKVRTEFIDPMENPELEKEAGEKYGIKPVPFQVTSKYQASVVNSYFDVLIKYGDKYQVLNFRDLIEVKAQTEGDMDVQLRNPEYEITRSIKKVLNEYQSGGNLFASLSAPVTFKGYFSVDNKLPEVLRGLRTEIQTVLKETKTKAGDKFQYSFIDPEADGGKVAKQIAEEFGFRPMQASLFDNNQFYFYMVLESQGQTVPVPLPEELNKNSFKLALDTALKRYSSGFMKTLALYTPPASANNPYMMQMGMSGGKEFTFLEKMLEENHNVQTANLDNGVVNDNADLLLLIAPDKLDEKQVFAVDQFLMKGGTVILASSPYKADWGRTGLSVSEHQSGIEDWLKYQGINIEKTMVLDPQNAMLPIPVSRNLGGFTVQEMQMVEYPYFIDVRGDGLLADNAITSGLPQVTMNWVSPVNVTPSKGKKVIPLLKSSEKSWVSDSSNVVPDFKRYPQWGFEPGEKRQSYTLATVVEGRFDSYFKDKDSPLLKKMDNKQENKGKSDEKTEDEKIQITSVIDKSPGSARIILLASNEFVEDKTIKMASSAGGVLYLNSLQLVANAVDWSLEDRGLLSIRSRSHFSRTLAPLTQQEQTFWEYLNYGLSLLGLLVIYLVYRFKRGQARKFYEQVLATEGGAA